MTGRAAVLGLGLLGLLLAGGPPARAGREDWFAGIIRKERDTTAVRTGPVRDSVAIPPELRNPPVVADTTLGFDELTPEPWGSEYHLRARLRRHGERDLRVTADYNRVDQLRLGGRLSPLPPEPYYPRLELASSYSMGRGQLNYSVTMEQPVAQAPYAALGGRLYRSTDSPDWGLVSRVENALSGFLERQDYLDYFGRRGVTAFGRLEWQEGSSIELNYHLDEITTLDARPETWSLFGGTRSFRPNPSVPEGNLHQVEAALELSSRRNLPAPRPGMDLHLWLDGAGGGLGGDFGFSRARAEYRWTFKFAPGLWLNQRAAFGTVLGGTAPPEFLFYAGGVGTLLGYEYKQFTGDRYYLYNVQYSVNLGQHIPHFDRNEMLRGLELVFFAETGKAWNHRGQGNNDSAHPAWDVGTGVQTSGDGFHLYLTQNPQSPHEGPKLSFRLSRSY